MKEKVIIAGSEGLIGSSVSEYLESLGKNVIKLDKTLGHDLTNESFVKDFFKKNKASALVNLFALNHHIDKKNNSNNLFDISIESFNKYLNVNLTALFSVCREYARNNSKGTIVNFSSTYGIVSPRLDLYEGNQKHIGYSVSKSGVLGLSKHLAIHLAPNIRVNTIIPGGVKNNQPESFTNLYNKNTPLLRMMNVKEINGLVEFLISKKSSYMTGSEIKIDGGWTAW